MRALMYLKHIDYLMYNLRPQHQPCLWKGLQRVTSQNFSLSHSHTFLFCSYCFLHSSSPSSEPLPLRSDKGQHFRILQYTRCMHRCTGTIASGCYHTRFAQLRIHSFIYPPKLCHIMTKNYSGTTLTKVT